MMKSVQLIAIRQANQLLEYPPTKPSTPALVPQNKPKSPATLKIPLMIYPGESNTGPDR
jgi:hypothetical protein